ncbi:MAG TPA: histidine phosphatase family protein [Steroidobacteraceae bacterium]|nr:histidine phosphatase family protein [Steroidobacteraceae bacterium]
MRHAKPAAAWGDDPDPGLDPLGVTQAAATAQRLAQALPRLPIYTSPLRRCRETSRPLCEAWKCEATVLPAVAEIPAPPLGVAERREWLAAALRSTWPRLQDGASSSSIDYQGWRRGVVDALLALPHDCVVYTHFIAINVAAAAEQQRDDVVFFAPDHASITVVEATPHGLRLIELGRQAQTAVLAR